MSASAPAGLAAKRALDVAASLAGIVVLSPVMLLVAALVAARLGRPVVFRQRRAGQHGRPFVLYKFRTMRDGHDASGAPLPDAVRLTPFGRALRSTSLDELPQLFNVLRGDMSLVGPRPLLMEYLPLYTPEQAERNRFKPGVTGWTQVNGRNALDWDARFELDHWYVTHWSFWLDVRILLRSVAIVLGRRGIGQGAEATSTRFTGSAGTAEPRPGAPADP